jgi:salicylate hydroxylase
MRRFDASGNLLHTKEFGPEDRSHWQTVSRVLEL